MDDRLVRDGYRGLPQAVDEHAVGAAVDDSPLPIGGFGSQVLLRDLRVIDLHAGLRLSADGHHTAFRLDRVRPVAAVHDQQSGP